MTAIQPTATNRAMKSIGWPLLVLSVVLTLVVGVLVYVIVQQAVTTNCINESLQVRQQFFNADHDAEVAKVSGQVKGLLEIRRNPQAGVRQFTRASEHYLHVIAALDKESHNHPLGRC